MTSILGGIGGIFKSRDQLELEMRQAAASGAPTAWDASQAAQAAQQLQYAMNQALYHGSDAANPPRGWAATNQAQGYNDPVSDLIQNPFQASALYFRLRLTKGQLKEKDIEIAFVRRMGDAVHVAIVNQDRILTMIDEDVWAFPSDAFLARIRLLL
jgi:hypothetical protein